MTPPTPEQAARCDALAKRVAELDPDWPQPGMAVRHERGGRWRLTGGEGRWLQEVGWKWHSANQVPADSDLRAAIANGPAWRDPATLGAILLSIPYEVPAEWDRHRLLAVLAELLPFAHAEAILAAKIAELGATQ